ncbi:hypothetical protein ACIBJF_07470 [Streptomyces sp. NPDC050743]|uniref:hypothetical protein n=1 Tax=Streptomyces sp. NPDC050743 TaxID=3365634 RepID=UPI00378D6941
MARDVGGRRAVGPVDLGRRSAVFDHGDLHRRDHQRPDTADRPDRIVEDYHLTVQPLPA